MMPIVEWGALRRRIQGHNGAIGVDFESNQIHLAQLDRRGDAYQLRAAESIQHPYPDSEALISKPAELRRTLNDAFKRGGFKGRHIVTHAPTRDLRLMVLNYNLEPERSEASQILDLAQERMRHDLSDHVLDFVPIRTSGDQVGERSALLAISPEEPVIQHLENLARAGVKVDALEIAPVSLRRLIATIGVSEPAETVLILRMRQTDIELILLSGQRLLVYREVEGGMQSILEEVARSLDCDKSAARDLLSSYGVDGPKKDETDRLIFENESLNSVDDAASNTQEIVHTLRGTLRPILRSTVEQVHKAISYAAFQTRGMTLKRVFLMEGTHSCPGLDRLFEGMLQLPVEVFDPGALLEPSSRSRDRRRVGKDFAVAIGLALRGLEDA